MEGHLNVQTDSGHTIYGYISLWEKVRIQSGTHCPFFFNCIIGKRYIWSKHVNHQKMVLIQA